MQRRIRGRGVVPVGLALVVSAWPVTTARAQEPPQWGGEPEAGRPRSVLFYLMDTTRQDRMGWTGEGRATTPFLAELAQRSVVFEACYSQAPWTKPSMASMLSSQYPSTTGVYRVEHRLDDGVRTWPEVLREHGYHTAGFSANIVMGAALSNFAQGFEHFVESTSINQGDPIRFASGSARKLNARVLPWLAATDRWPLLLYVHSVDPHEEYEPAPEYLERFADPARHERFREEWQRLLASRPPIPGLYVTRENFERAGVEVEPFIEHASGLYDADVLANDDALRELWAAIEADGWGEDLVFVLTSDHGEEFFDHGATSHGYSLYDEMTRVPLLIHAPGLLPAGKRIGTPVRSLDVYPTLCELLGLEVPEGLEGRSLLPLIRESSPESLAEPWPAVLSEHREDPILRRVGHGSGVMVSLRTERWTFILNDVVPQLLPRPTLELYDRSADPGELENVADQHPEVVERFEARAREFLDRQRGEAATGEMDPAVLAQLQALGYVGEAPRAAPELGPAIEAEDLEALRRALAAGADPNALDEAMGTTPLFSAAARGNAELVLVLLDAGAEVDGRNRDGATPSHGAALLGRVEVLDLLLEEGADAQARNAMGSSVAEAAGAPWELTKFVADVLGIPVDREEVEAGRLLCLERLAEPR